MALPTTVRKRDGRLVSFEPEKISLSLFAVTEEMGTPNAFLARELTDGVLHFLSLEPENDSPTVSHISDLVAKVVRELGYPAIAKSYEEFIRDSEISVRSSVERLPAADLSESPPLRGDPFASLRLAAAKQWREFSLARIYPRDLVSAHRDDLLRLMDLDYPHEIAGLVWPPSRPIPAHDGDLLESFIAARALAGSFIAIDSPEYSLASAAGEPNEIVASFLRTLGCCAQFTGLNVILNLNIAATPPWAEQRNLGPLFQGIQPEIERDRVERIAAVLLERSDRHTIYWHLSERDLIDESRLSKSIGATARTNVEFVFDDPKLAVRLGPGIDRGHPAALGCTGLNLPRFVHQLGADASADIYLKKLESLARFAKSAGHWRQDFLRKAGQPELQHGFLLERAVHLLLPIGVLDAARQILGNSGTPEDAIELARASLETIRQALANDRPRLLSTSLDGPPGTAISDQLALNFSDISPRREIRFGSELLKAAGGGSLAVSPNKSPSADVPLLHGDLIRLAFKHGACRVRFQ